MKALVTGASSGIGRDIAKELHKRGYSLILVGQNKERLKAVNKKLGGNHKMISVDLSIPQNCIKLYNAVKDENIDVLINNAGFGVFGEFTETDLKKETDMINVNIVAVHTLMKLFLRDFCDKDKGYILNVSSAAAFLPGPLLASYYATKSYVYKLTLGVEKELRKKNSRVQLSVLCPGPVQTNFSRRAGIRFASKGIKSSYAAKYAVEKLFDGQVTIIPGKPVKVGVVASKLIPDNILADFAYQFQKLRDKE